MRQFVFTLCVHEQAGGLTDIAACTAMISDNENGGTAIPAQGRAAFSAMAAVIAELGAGVTAGKVRLFNGISEGVDIDRLKDAAVANELAALSGVPMVRVFPEGNEWFWAEPGGDRHGPFRDAITAGLDARAVMVRAAQLRASAGVKPN